MATAPLIQKSCLLVAATRSSSSQSKGIICLYRARVCYITQQRHNVFGWLGRRVYYRRKYPNHSTNTLSRIASTPNFLYVSTLRNDDDGSYIHLLYHPMPNRKHRTWISPQLRIHKFYIQKELWQSGWGMRGWLRWDAMAFVWFCCCCCGYASQRCGLYSKDLGWTVNVILAQLLYILNNFTTHQRMKEEKKHRIALWLVVCVCVCYLKPGSLKGIILVGIFCLKHLWSVEFVVLNRGAS